MEATIEDVKKAVEDAGIANKARLDTFEKQITEIKENGKVSGETKAQLEKITKELAEFEAIKAMPERLKLIEANLKRYRSSKGEEQEEIPEDHKEAKASHDMWMRQGENIKADNSWAYAKHNPRSGVKSLSVQSDPDGGYMVRHDLNGRIVERIFETSDMRAICSVQAVSTDALEGIYDDNTAVSGGWVGETEARPLTATPQVGKWVIPVHEQYAYPFTTQKNLDDSSINPEEWLAKKVGDILGRTENTAFVAGTGLKQPRGPLNYASGTALRTQIERIKTGASGDVTYAGLTNILMGLKGAYRARARWGMARTALAKVMALVDGYGRPLWVPSMIQGAPSMLLGLPISELNDMEAPGSGSLSIAVADWQEAIQIVDRQGVRILRNPFATLGYVGFYTTKRVGADVINTEAIKIGYMSA